jgi:hypothetical protein
MLVETRQRGGEAGFDGVCDGIVADEELGVLYV